MYAVLFYQVIDLAPLFSVVTVVFNDAENLNKTIESVSSQTFNNFEYLVIDGASTDHTLSVIKENKEKVNIWLSEKDDGIYDAMNKGITLATGQWIIFMNAGDVFFDSNTLNNASKFVDPDFDFVYGNNRVFYPGSQTKMDRKAGDVSKLWRGSQFCHQSVFVKSEYHKKNLYNIKNDISADFEFFYTSYMAGRNFKKVDALVSIISAGGVSDINRVRSIVGWWRVVDKNILINIYYASIIFRETLKKIVKLFMPKPLRR